MAGHLVRGIGEITLTEGMMGTDGNQRIAPSTLAISLLGPLEIRRGAATIQVPQNKHRVVIAVLALRMGTIVSVDDLITYLWTNQPPATAKKTLQGYVARIRRLLGRDVVTTHPSGYALAAAHVDVVTFEQLLDLAKSDSDQNRRLARLRKALALVRGEPLADIWSERLQHGPAASLTERWLKAIEHRIDSEIEAGNHESVLPELHELLAAHPLREPFWRQFMHALYRAGQQAEALSAFHRLRNMLIKELGVEPSPSVRALHAQILAHDPVLMKKPYSRARDLYGCPGRGGACTASVPPAACMRIAAELARAGFALPGTLTVRSYACGKPTCRCHADPPRLHGPYAEWTRKIEGKTVTRRLTPRELAEYRPLFDNAKRLRALIAQLQDLTVEIIEASNTRRSLHRTGATCRGRRGPRRLSVCRRAAKTEPPILRP